MSVRRHVVRSCAVLLVLACWGVEPALAQDAPTTRERTRYVVGLGDVATPSATKTGQRPLATTSRPPDVGDTRDFNTRGFLERGWETVTFTLKAVGDDFHLWVANNELTNGHVTDADVAVLAEALGTRTPAGSINPEAGILENNRSLFGDLPNFDGDGILDILWFNIRDDYPSASPLVAYFTVEDYDPNTPANIGNKADVLYLDTNPLLIGDDFGMEDVQEVTAGIHQSLIHFNYDPDEITFLRAGLFEWAKLLNGYTSVGTGYLKQPVEHGVPLLSFAGFVGDVERANLFITYLAEQFGPEATRILTQTPEPGEAGLRATLNALQSERTLEEVILDFHTANLINDTNLDPRFGYTSPHTAALETTPTRLFDASLDDETPNLLGFIEGGGVHYPAWDNIEDLRATLDVTDPATRDDLHLRALLERLDGTRALVELMPQTDAQMLSGKFNRITVIGVNINPAFDEGEKAASVLALQYAATWKGTAFPVLNTSYDSGRFAGTGQNLLQLEADARQATRFVVPEDAGLQKVFLAPFYINQFIGTGGPNGSPADPRDLTLSVWNSDGHDRPGDLLFALNVLDPRPFSFVLNNDLHHFPLDLSGYEALATLPDTIYVSIANAGEDDNALVLVVSQYQTANTSFLYDANADAWVPLWDLRPNGGTLSNRVIPIRAQFRLEGAPVAIDAGPEIPQAAVLHANYPNPFNPATTLHYDLPTATPVRLTIYDVLGRTMAVLVDTTQPAGTYNVPLNAAGWTSGLYFYTLETNQQRHTRAMVLLK